MSVDVTTSPAGGLLQLAHNYVRALRVGAIDCVALMLGADRRELESQIANVSPASRRLIIGLSTWIGIVSLSTAGGLIYVDAPASIGVVAAGPHEPKVDRQSQKTFDAIVQRSLFSKTRQAATVAPFGATREPISGALDRSVGLKGVLINGNFAKAFLISGQSPVGVWRTIGDEFGGWRVEEISRDHVILASQNDRLTVPLSFAKGR